MKLIAHRGNIFGPNPEKENRPEYIVEAINQGYDCELDVRYIDGQYYLGHDHPDYHVDISFFLTHLEKIWIHCKNFEAFDHLIQIKELNIFWHENDQYTLTSHLFLWSHPGKPTSERSIIVMPEWHDFIFGNGYGICTDFVDKLNNDFIANNTGYFNT
jgi:hypothetical protein